ncbi:MAG: class I SAM-dependent methyltransferase [Peptococcaceae bacterium]|nr:class I SAM-dependent methyltransferase [Peptococcaceae bacterium]
MKTSANHINFAVTTAQKQLPDMVSRAKDIASVLNCVYIERKERPIRVLINALSVSGLIVVSAGKLSFVSGGGEEFFFHPGLAGIRIHQLSNGQADWMIEAMSLLPGDSVLDCTLGLGTDAIVAGYMAGAAGRVVGLECSSALAFLVKVGLQTYISKDRNLTEAMKRVQVVQMDHLDYLRGLDADSFDVVYFDPMFRMPRMRSTAINALRILADPTPVDCRAVSLAVRVARKRVIMKERRDSPEFERLGFTAILGGRYAPIKYGVIDCYGQ